MSLHIEFCLDEIDWEIKSVLDEALDDIDRVSLQRHVDGMRAIVAFARIRCAAHQKTTTAADDDLTLVKGIGHAERMILNGIGVRSFAAIANWRRNDIKALADHGILLERIACENWIEQAAVLASGAKTHFASSEPAGRAGLIEWGPQNDTITTVDDQTATSNQLRIEFEAEATESNAFKASNAPATNIGETPLTPVLSDRRPNQPKTAAPRASAGVIPFAKAAKSQQPMMRQRARRVAVVAVAVILTVLGVDFVAHQQLGDLPAIVVSDLHPPIE